MIENFPCDSHAFSLFPPLLGASPFQHFSIFFRHQNISLFSLLTHRTISRMITIWFIFADSSLLFLGLAGLPLAPSGPKEWRRFLWSLSFSVFHRMLSHSLGKANQRSIEITENTLSSSVDEGWGSSSSSSHLLRQDHTACENLLRRHTSVSMCNKTYMFSHNELHHMTNERCRLIRALLWE